MLPCVCPIIVHRRRQDVARTTSVTQTPTGFCAQVLFFPHFDVICDLLLNRGTATWNLFGKWYKLTWETTTVSVIIIMIIIITAVIITTYYSFDVFLPDHKYSTKMGDWKTTKLVSLSSILELLRAKPLSLVQSRVPANSINGHIASSPESNPRNIGECRVLESQHQIGGIG